MTQIPPACFMHLMGGLGNQLFQIAITIAHCNRNGYTLAISKSTQGGRPVYWDSFLHNLAQYTVNSSNTRYNPWNEPHFHYSPIPAGAQSLYGYFQSSKYFADAVVSSEIRRLFVPHPRIIATVNEKYSGVVTPHSVAVHVRRGDYLHDNSSMSYHFVTTPAYFERAVAKARELDPSAEFVVFSEDTEWCRAQPYFAGATIIDEPDECLTLELMSRFQHYIISNSSFSWWATWLGTPARTVLVPDRWFGPHGPQDYEDVYEPSWIRIPV